MPWYMFFGAGFVFASLFWGVVAHKWPALFSKLDSQGAAVVNNLDSTVKGKIANTVVANTTVANT